MSDGIISIDRAALKVLASDTRIAILKLLDRRRYTVTEIARELELNKATCFEHLEKLAEVNLVQKLEDDRKWVYYQLSWKGRRILHPEKMAIALMLSSALGSGLVALTTFWFWFKGSIREIAPEFPGDDGGTSGDAGSTGIAQEMRAPAAPEPDVVTELVRDPALLWLTIGAGVALIALCIGAWYLTRKMRARGDIFSDNPA